MKTQIVGEANMPGLELTNNKFDVAFKKLQEIFGQFNALCYNYGLATQPRTLMLD